METIQALVTAAQNGDLEAFAELVRRFQAMAYAGAYAVVGDAQLAEDVAQEAFMEAFSNLPKLREPAAFPGWFRRIIFKQGDRLIRGKHLSTMSLETAFSVQESGLNPEHIIEKREMSEQVRHAVQLLPEQERLVTILFYSTRYTLKEIATFLEVPVTTVKKRLYEARQRLKEELLEGARESFYEYQPADTAHFPEQVQLLFDYGAKINVLTCNGMTPLHIATLYHAQKTLKLLLTHGANANAMFANGHTPLHWAALKGYTDSPAMLLAHGANVNARSDTERTPLHWAALKGHSALVNLLLAHAADNNARDELGYTPLDWAKERGHEAVISLIQLEKGHFEEFTNTGQTNLSQPGNDGSNALKMPGTAQLVGEQGRVMQDLF